MKIKLAKSEIIHFIGIGGIGMSGLSLIMKGKGFKVQGSDIASNKNIERLKKENIKITIGHKKQNINTATIIVVSSAIKKNNPELIEAKKKQLPIYKRGEMLANIVSLTKNIVVVGSHGKTTTTSLIASIFQETKIDPTIINGGVINSINNSAKLGKSDWSILEADESDGSFVYIPPTYSIITNIDREHMDFYSSMDELNKYFIKFANKVPSFGKSFICIDDKNNKNLIKKLSIKNYYTYGTDLKANFCIKNIKQSKDYSEFDLKIILPNKKNRLIKKIKIPLLGIHNIRNSVAAAALSIIVGLSVSSVKKGLKNFKGVQRRFNKNFTFNKVDFFDDYAHHPTEIKVVLDGVNSVYKDYEKICVFQPHRISRLKDLITESYKDEKILILAPIVKARKGHYRDLFENILKQGFIKVRVDGTIQNIISGLQLDRYKSHDIEIVIDRLEIKDAIDKRLKDSIETALKYGKGVLKIYAPDKDEFRYFSKNLMCPSTGIAYDDPEPNIFSFNSPKGACKTCNGLGMEMIIDKSKIIPDPSLSIERGGLAPISERTSSWIDKQLDLIAKRYKFSLKDPINTIPKKAIDVILNGAEESFKISNLSPFIFDSNSSRLKAVA